MAAGTAAAGAAAGAAAVDCGVPLQLSQPLFTWDATAAGEGVCLDELHQRVIHRRPDGFTTTDLLEDGGSADGLNIQCSLPGLRQVRFSPDGLLFAFVCSERQMGLLETMRTNREPLPLTFKWSSKTDLQVLDFFWLPVSTPDYAELVVVTTYGLELLRLSLDTLAVKSMKTFPTPARLCWVEPLTGMVLVCSGAKTLQPFDFKTKAPKLAKFDLVLGHGQTLLWEDVVVMPIYDATFCIHADSTNGRVSLRNISNPQQGTPEHDIVIDVADEEVSIGTLRLSNVDNLLVVHCLDKDFSVIYDIRHKEKGIIPCISGPCALYQDGASGHDLAWKTWRFVNGPTIVDNASGFVHQLKVDMVAVSQDFLARTPSDLATVMRLMLRRTDCRRNMIWALRRALASRPSLNDWAQAFTVLNQAYRQFIEAISRRGSSGTGSSRQTTVSLAELEALISNQSVMSENHMVSQVFHPHFVALTGISVHEPAVEGGDSTDRWRIPLPSAAAKVAANKDSRPARSPYVLSVVIAYLRSLLSMQILPHKILQCFVFDICMYFQQEDTLQQLLQFQVLLDSPVLVDRLKEVALTRSRPWAVQVCLDMAMRIDELSSVAEMLLHTRQYIDVVPFLVTQRQPSFKLRLLLERIEADETARSEDPELLGHVVTEIRSWFAEAEAKSRLAQGEELCPPDLEGCERWMPELALAPIAVGGPA